MDIGSCWETIPFSSNLPEVPFEMDAFLRDVEQALKQQPNVVVCVSEGIKDRAGRLICEYTSEAQMDTFGHKMLTGCAKLLESYVRNRFGIKVRSVELNVNQRCASLMSSLTDIEEADQSGRQAVTFALSGQTAGMVACRRADTPDGSYRLEYSLTAVSNVCNKEKGFPVDWITQKGTDIGPQFLEYALPLIAGEPERIMELGLPKYLSRSRKTPA